VTGQPKQESGSGRLGIWGWVAIVALFGILGAAIWYALHALRVLAGVDMPATSWVYLALGAAITLVFGAGLMGLLFYSSRKGKDF
jgi:hypothetical protein